MSSAACLAGPLGPSSMAGRAPPALPIKTTSTRHPRAPPTPRKRLPPCAIAAAGRGLHPAHRGRATGGRRPSAAETRAASGAPGRTRCDR
eukprot:6643706-Pyramimonas_sp.AAC.1